MNLNKWFPVRSKENRVSEEEPQHRIRSALPRLWALLSLELVTSIPTNPARIAIIINGFYIKFIVSRESHFVTVAQLAKFGSFRCSNRP